MSDEKEIYHLYAPQDETADTEADRAIKDSEGNVIVDTYLTSESLSDYVTLDTEQTITGDKEITGNIHINGTQGKVITIGQSADNPRVTIDQWSCVVGFTDGEGGFNEFNPCDSDFGAIPSFDRLGVYDLNAANLDVADNTTIENLRVKTIKAGNTTVKGQNIYNFEEPCTFNFGITSSGETEYYGVFNTYDPDYDGPRFNFLAIGGLTVERDLYIPSMIRAYTPNVGTYTITFPTKNGTVALTSDLYDYLPLTGGTIVSRIAENTDENVISNREITIRSNDRNYYSTFDKNGITVSTLGSYGSTKVQLNGFYTAFGKYGQDGYRYASDGIHKISRGIESSLYTFPSESGTLALGELKITWLELKALRDENKLVPGRQYRITDYTCTTSQANTSSAGHQFDVIVVADSINKLNEVARACLHEGDTYFANSKLEAWQLWYCLDNDTARFDWAQVPVEEHLVAGNMLFFRASQYDGVKGNYCWFNSDSDMYTFTDTLNASTGSFWKLLGSTWIKIDDVNVQYVPASSEGKGVIYRMIDEFNNDIPYDFKNILFTASGKYANAYTFSYTESDVIKDTSIDGANKICHDNTMKAYILSTKQTLNFNVFYSNSDTFKCYGNIFDVNCHNNTFNNNCWSNKFGRECYSNTFARACYDNIFGNECYANVFEEGCYKNIFGNSCSINIIGSMSHENVFGNDCYSNSFGSECYANTFNNDCNQNVLGNACSRNIFGDHCFCIKFGDASHPIDYCHRNIFDSGCNYIYLISDDTVGSTANYLQNVHVHLGVHGTSSDRKTLTVPDRNLDYETNFIAIGTNDVSI